MSKIPGGMSFASWTKKPYSPATDGMHVCLLVLERGADRHEMTRLNLFAVRHFILSKARRRDCCTSRSSRGRLVGIVPNLGAQVNLTGNHRQLPLLRRTFPNRLA